MRRTPLHHLCYLWRYLPLVWLLATTARAGVFDEGDSTTAESPAIAPAACDPLQFTAAFNSNRSGNVSRNLGSCTSPPVLNPSGDSTDNRFCTGTEVALAVITKDSLSLTTRWRATRLNGSIDQSYYFTQQNSFLWSDKKTEIIRFNQPGEYQISLRISNSCGKDTTVCGKVYIYDKPILDIKGPTTPLCGPATVNLSAVLQAGTPLGYKWSFRWVNGTNPPQWPMRRDSTALAPFTLLPGEYEIRLRAGGLCDSSNVVRKTIVVVPPPVANAGGGSASQLEVCARDTFLLAGELQPEPYINYRWTPLDGSDSVFMQSYPAQVSIGRPGTYRYQLKAFVGAVNTPSCESYDTVTVVVRPKPKVTIGDGTPARAVCLGDSPFTLTATVDPVTPGIQGKWIGPIITKDGVFAPDTVGIFVVGYTYQNEQGCADTARLAITVTPRPVVALTGKRNFCPGDSPTKLQVNPASPAGVWSYPANPGAITSEGTFSPGVAGTGQHNLTYTLSNIGAGKCTYVYTLAVSVVDENVDLIPVNQINVCQSEGIIALPTPLLQTGTWIGAGVTSDGRFDPKAIKIVNNDSTKTTLRYTVAADGCAVSDLLTVNVLPAATVSLTNLQPTYCAYDAPVTLSATPAGGTWFVGGQPLAGTTFDPAAFPADSTYWVRYQVSNQYGCVSADSMQVMIVNVTADFSVPDTLCAGKPVTFTNLSTGPPGSFQWFYKADIDPAATSTGTTGTFTYADSGTYVVRLIATAQGSGCTDTAEYTVHVLPTPDATVTAELLVTNPQDTCGVQTYQFRPLYETKDAAATYLWTFDNGDSSTLREPDPVTFVSDSVEATTYQVTLRIITRCDTAVSSLPITVNPLPVARFAPELDTICADQTILFNNFTYGSQSAYTWNFGDGTPPVVTTQRTNVSHTFRYAGPGQDTTYRVTLSVNGPCGPSTYQDNIFVTRNRVQSFFNVPSRQGCAPFTQTFTSNQLAGRNQLTWIWGDGSTSAGGIAQTHTFNQAGTYTVQLVVENACNVDTFSQQIVVNPLPEASFTLSSANLCIGEELILTNTLPNPFQSRWNFGDGTTSDLNPAPPHRYDSAGTYVVTLRVTNPTTGCRQTVQRTVTVSPRMTPAFMPLRDELRQDSALFTFNNLSTPQMQGATFTWDFGDESAPQTIQDYDPILHQYTEAGTFTVTLYTTTPGGCRDSVSHPVTVLPVTAVPDFTAQITEACAPVVVTFENLSKYATSYTWDFGNGTSSQAANPPPITYAVPGTYTVRLVVRNAIGVQEQIKTNYIIVNERPVAGFTVSTTAPEAPNEEVFFRNQSSGADSYLWDFGDGLKSTEPEPRHAYRESGVYDVQLIAYNAEGCIDTLTLYSIISAQEGKGLQLPNAFTPRGGALDFSQNRNDFFAPLTEGASQYELRVFNRWGEILFETHDPKRGWDGYFNGQLLPQDVYVYRLKVTFTNGQYVEHVGEVTLVR
ncbi:gliding motility-associated C-terminal domain-containing protein [Catalinimonas alkaloidigena]|uniref:Gliding motility-associated C-terminal domain-containing protein n=1 Tax=Catalinimonas alkaloidigena TaxID=1075417 RepID=A0A1G9GV23_9BACT|nr:PKD domain-containing protein [Catalinimonas alkaloidigena]SDL04123.1 gliding motility-associated C-terminal domain-containing protein [Catalinimonas alkaloidigena]